MQSEISIKNNLINELISFLTKGNAHVTFHDAIKNIPFDDLGKVPGNLPYSIWQIVEHIRIAQKDILDFSANTNYNELNWPDDYWPKETAPKDEIEWKKSLKQIDADLNEFIELLKSYDDLFKPFNHGSGQNLAREAMLIADHNSYHVGEIIVVRRFLGNWKS
jgi:uncharacterized damage-inducible protein DinB